jgi:hypothetical protein
LDEDKKAIGASIQAVLPRVQECFERALKSDPSLAGRVEVAFELEPADGGGGRVTSGEISDSETRSPLFEACVLQRVAGATFAGPKFSEKISVRYPFIFDPGGGFGGIEE